MKSKIKLVFILFFFTVLAISVQGIELELYGGVGDIYFDPESTKSLDTFKQGELSLVAGASVSGEINERFFFSAGFERDSTLKNQIFANFGVNLSFFSVQAGGFTGILNSDENEFFNPGISAGLGLQFPGIFFLNVRAMASVNSIFGTVETYSQRGGFATIGFWVPNVIISANGDIRNYTQKKGSNLEINDWLFRYFLRGDFYKKNFPFTFQVDLGYGSLQRSYARGSSDPDVDELRYVYAGFKGTYVINSLLKVFLAGEMPVYSWSVEPMEKPDNGLLFQAQAGIVFTFH